jgi:flagellar biosynthesis/type III secretory pathway M-ring protein FliF/YscJ
MAVGARRALPQPVTADAGTNAFLELARRNPEQTAQVIRQWVAGAE